MLTDTRDWARRAWSAQVNWWRIVLPALGLIWFFAALLVYIFLFLIGWYWMVFWTVVIFALAAILYLFYNLVGLYGLWMGLRELGGGSGVPGLYSRGIQTTVGPWDGGLFIPYQEIDRITPLRSWFYEFIDIFIKGSKPRAARLPREFLGDEGLQTLLMMAGKGPRAPSPPRLVLNAPADSVITTEGTEDRPRPS